MKTKTGRKRELMLTALKEMIDGKSITALEYAKRYDTTRLGARIFDLRQLFNKKYGQPNIKSVDAVDKYGERYVKYTIVNKSKGKRLLKDFQKGNK
jgi:hypothetical protein